MTIKVMIIVMVPMEVNDRGDDNSDANDDDGGDDNSDTGDDNDDMRISFK